MKDAVAAAGGKDDFGRWKRYSGILRKDFDGFISVIPFTSREQAQIIALKPNDQIYFGMPVF